MVIVGGENNAAIPNTGGRYDPSNDTWTPTALFGDPPPLTSQTAVWTGSLMVVWGGVDNFTPYLNTGGRYDPATDSWTTTTTTGAPTARFSHTAVWTGNVMIVWGGGPDNALAGGRYDPLTDSWLPTSTTGAPFEREVHSAVWTGTSMIVWGGTNSSSGNHTATGGRYDPLTDTWTPTSTIGAPFQRVDHTAVWTGSEMIVWGGYTGFAVTPLNTGGRYNPATNSWAPTSIVNVPSARWAHPAVWTGTRMIVWSGAGSGGPSNTGGLYDPSGDTWSPTSTSGAPVARHEHSAVWTGDVMVNWGGFTGSGDILNSGGRYDPATDSWNPTSTAGAPKLNLHTEVWTGNMMIVWGGNEGGRYVIGSGCDDGNPCTDDSCDQAAGCGHTNNTNACNDGSACTTADVCSGGVCVGGAETNCDDGNACTTDSCDPATGCVVTNNTDPCTDGNACTTGDACGGGACVGGAPVTCAPPDQCHEDGTCDLANGACSYANKPDGTTCDDGDSNTTGDACQSGICMGGASCDTTPKPKPYGYYKKLCKDGHGHPNTHEDVLTDADAACVAALTDTFAGISTVEDLCAVLESSGGSGDGHDSKECVKGEQELMTTALNVCRQRICLTQEIDSQCAPGPHVLTTVQDSLDTADDILSDPGRNKNVCSDARCLVKEANNGHGIHHTSLLLNKESGNKVRLTWASPVMEDGSGEATGYTIWRRELHSPMPFTQIGATDSSALTCADTTAGNWEYEVTFTIEP
jgi:hypothetical protein